MIDPQGDPQYYIEKAHTGGMRISHIFETHIQVDHRSTSRELSRLTNAEIFVGPGAKVSFPHTALAGGQIISMGGRRFRIFHTPGHTPEHIVILVNDWFLLTGDTLFVGDVGRVDLEEGVEIEKSAEKLYQSLQELLSLPEWTEIYPAHFGGSVCGRGMDGKPISTVGREKLKNPALRMSLTEFADFQKKDAPLMPQEACDIKRYNSGLGN